MSLADSLRDAGLAGRLAREIARALEAVGRPVRIMEVCGTHTVALRRTGVRSLLPPGITLVSGPGCPVCVTPTGFIDAALQLVEQRGARVATFGDMLKVPGSDGRSLSRYLGSERVRVVYGPGQLPAVAAEQEAPLVFLGVGFETTVPAVAAVFLRDGLPGNLSMLVAFKRVVPALEALLDSPGFAVDAFLLPGHVSAIIGTDAYRLLEERGVLGVVAGFEPADMLHAILLILRQLASRRAEVENAYRRAVRSGGNPRALALMDRLLEPRDELWRGLGTIPGSGLGLRPAWRSRDAAVTFGLPAFANHDPPECRCGDVIQGAIEPEDCPLFGGGCTPERPRGPCMVSSEGACAAHLLYE